MPVFFHFEYQSYIVLLTLVNDYYTDPIIMNVNFNYFEWYFTNDTLQTEWKECILIYLVHV